ncbi:putative Scaffold protein Nfu/NifU N terminal/NifU-like domain containing protein [Leishmania naiffi]|uniref:Scaffold protein Nfu/NifU N terminal/NifU-like domain containing protein n=1 Tax=Leishmania naiffi TaxID=5678 RepID=A0AAW3B9R4_9TRYP
MRLGGLTVSFMTLTSASPTTWRRGLTSRQSALCSSLIPCCCRTPQRTVFVRFQPTPNDACYKFYVDHMQFLPPHAHTMLFNRTNSYLSPLAHALLEALPMVEEVTVGASFVTVKHVEVADTEAAARYFAMTFHGVQQSNEADEAAAAARSQALQQHATDVMNEDSESGGEAAAQPCSGDAAPTASSFSTADASFDIGGFTISSSSHDNQIDEAVLQSLIVATDWSELKFHVSALLTDHICSGNPHVDPNAPNPHADTVAEAGDSEVVLMIKELVATTIRPQLQEDGGDLRFIGFDPVLGDMRVELLGACRTCKNSKTALVDLIERTTRHWIPEVKAVKEVSRTTSAFEELAAHHSTAAAVGATGFSSSSLTDRLTEEVDDGLLNAKGRVQFSPSPTLASARAASGAYKIVREVRASSVGEATTTCPAAAPS